tara:strand:- start:8 stop:199 length:192 start_codon:yes stop_codon:yes gene_type:complete
MKIKHKTHSKTFAIITDNRLQLITKETKEDATTYCQNYLDNSKEIIVREIKQIQDFISPIINI